MNTLYEIAGNYLEALENITIDEETGEVLGTESVDNLKDDLQVKAENIACYYKSLVAFSDNLKAEADELTKRAKSYAKKSEWLKSYLDNCLTSVGMTKIETARCKLTYRKSTSVEITDERLLPKEYVLERIEYRPQKDLIKETIKSGKEVPGAALVEKQNIQIK